VTQDQPGAMIWMARLRERAHDTFLSEGFCEAVDLSQKLGPQASRRQIMRREPNWRKFQEAFLIKHEIGAL